MTVTPTARSCDNSRAESVLDPPADGTFIHIGQRGQLINQDTGTAAATGPSAQRSPAAGIG